MVFPHNGRLGVYIPPLLKKHQQPPMLPCGTRYHLHPPPILFSRPTPVLRLCTIVILPFLPLLRRRRLRGSKPTQNNLVIAHSRNPAIPPPSPRIPRSRSFRDPCVKIRNDLPSHRTPRRCVPPEADRHLPLEPGLNEAGYRKPTQRFFLNPLRPKTAKASKIGTKQPKPV